MHEKQAKHEKPAGYIERCSMELKNLNIVRFDPSLGLLQTVTQDVEVPNGARGMIVRFGLTDINVRRLYWKMTLR